MKKLLNVLLIIIMLFITGCDKHGDIENNENETNEGTQEQTSTETKTYYIYVSEDGKYQTIIPILQQQQTYHYTIESLVSDGKLYYSCERYGNNNLVLSIYFNFPPRDLSNDPYYNYSTEEEYNEQKEYILNLDKQYNYDNCMNLLNSYGLPESIFNRMKIADYDPVAYIIIENRSEYREIEKYFIDLICDKGVKYIGVYDY